MIHSSACVIHPMETYMVNEGGHASQPTDKMMAFAWPPAPSAVNGVVPMVTVTAQVHNEPEDMCASSTDCVEQLLQDISLDDDVALPASSSPRRGRKRKKKVVRRDSSASDYEVGSIEPMRTRRTRSADPPMTDSYTEENGDCKVKRTPIRLRSTRSFKTRSKNINLLSIDRAYTVTEPRTKRLKK